MLELLRSAVWTYIPKKTDNGAVRNFHDVPREVEMNHLTDKHSMVDVVKIRAGKKKNLNINDSASLFWTQLLILTSLLLLLWYGDFDRRYPT